MANDFTGKVRDTVKRSVEDVQPKPTDDLRKNSKRFLEEDQEKNEM